MEINTTKLKKDDEQLTEMSIKNFMGDLHQIVGMAIESLSISMKVSRPLAIVLEKWSGLAHSSNTLFAGSLSTKNFTSGSDERIIIESLSNKTYKETFQLTNNLWTYERYFVFVSFKSISNIYILFSYLLEQLWFWSRSRASVQIYYDIDTWRLMDLFEY